MESQDTSTTKNFGSRGKGRPKGIPNKKTMEFKAIVADLIEANKENVAKWLTAVAEGGNGEKPDPGKALDLIVKLAEFAYPKLARTEVTGAEGGPVMINAMPLDLSL